MYYIVQFSDGLVNYTEVIPATWFDSKECVLFWPNSKRVKSLIKSKGTPKSNWLRYPASIMRSFETLERAQQKLSVATLTSDINSDCENEIVTRKRVKKNFHSAERGAGLVKRRKGDQSPLSGTSPPLDLPLPPASLEEHFTETNSDLCCKTPIASKSQNQNNNIVVDAIKELQKTVTKQIYSLKLQVSNVEARMEKMLSTFESNPGQSENQRIQLEFEPFNTVHEFESFDESIKADLKKGEQMVLLFTKCGGDKTTDSAGRCLRKLFSNDLARLYSLKGKMNNMNFEATTTYTKLKAALLNRKSLRSTEKEIDKAVSEWFRHATDRLKRRANLTGSNLS